MTESINILIEKIREEERQKIMQEIKVNKKPLDKVSDCIDEWGLVNEIHPRDLYKIKTGIYTIIRYSLKLDRMANLEMKQTDIAVNVAEILLGMIGR